MKFNPIAINQCAHSVDTLPKGKSLILMAEAHFAPKNTLLFGTLCFSRAKHTWQPKTLGKVRIYSSAHLPP